MIQHLKVSFVPYRLTKIYHHVSSQRSFLNITERRYVWYVLYSNRSLKPSRRSAILSVFKKTVLKKDRSESVQFFLWTPPHTNTNTTTAIVFYFHKILLCNKFGHPGLKLRLYIVSSLVFRFWGKSHRPKLHHPSVHCPDMSYNNVSYMIDVREPWR